MKYLKRIVIAVGVLSPIAALAQTLTETADISQITDPFSDLVIALVPILMTAALLFFIWGLIMYIRSAGDPEKASEGKSIMIYGVIALFVMSAIWGLTGFIGGVFGIDQGVAPDPNLLRPH
ncbi:MAG: pilin [Patescibacteria group bacterium]